MTSERDWAAWWRVYRRYVLHHAMLARYAGAELFSVGVELERTVERPEWAELIAAVRRIYPGAVTYAANWGGGADRAVFWDRLDAVGVDAYYPLAGETSGVDDRHLDEGARRVVERLEGLARRTGKPLILTEVGFAARRGTWTAPHEEGGEASAEDQARAYRALLGALAGPAARSAAAADGPREGAPAGCAASTSGRRSAATSRRGAIGPISASWGARRRRWSPRSSTTGRRHGSAR